MLIEKIIEVESRVPGLLVVHFPRGKVLEDVLGLEDTFSSPWPRGHIFKSLASKPQVLENYPVLGSRTALFFEWLKFCRPAEKCFSRPFFF